MDPNLEEKQSDQSQEKQSEGRLSQGINTLNNLNWLKNSFGKTGSGTRSGTVIKTGRLAAQFGTKIATFLFTTPTGWVTLGIVVIVVFTVVIIASLGAAPINTGVDQVVGSPTITLAPPAAP